MIIIKINILILYCYKSLLSNFKNLSCSLYRLMVYWLPIKNQGFYQLHCQLMVDVIRALWERLHHLRTNCTRRDGRIGRIANRDPVTASSISISCRLGPSRPTGSTRPSSSREWRSEKTTCSTRSWSAFLKDSPFAKSPSILILPMNR